MFTHLQTRIVSNVLKQLERTMAYYAVAKGRKVGIYPTWPQCEEQVKGFKGAVYKKFPTRHEAEEFLRPGATSGTSENYVPDDIAVPLGKKNPPQVLWTLTKHVKRKNADFWPKDVPEEGEDVLMTAMDEVEGFIGRKRKANDINSTSKIRKLVSQEPDVVAFKQFGPFEFPLDFEGYVIVYTDGSCLGNGKSNACAGFGVYFGDNHPLNAAKPVLGRVTNNVGEIQASIYAIKTALDLGIKKLSINTDSQFLIKSITLWVKGWIKRNWCLPNGQPVKNVADFKELDELLQNDEIEVKWNYVKAHTGIKGNEKADQLARDGALLYSELNK